MAESKKEVAYTSGFNLFAVTELYARNSFGSRKSVQTSEVQFSKINVMCNVGIITL